MEASFHTAWIWAVTGLVNDDVNDMTQVLQHRNVAHGERQALCTKQNQWFQDMCDNRPSTPLHEDEGVMAPKIN
jgi:hypothetical protein